MKKVDSQIPKRNDKRDAGDPPNNQLDKRSLAFFGLDFQSADVRHGPLEVNLGPGTAGEGVFDLATLAGMGKIRKCTVSISRHGDRFGLWLSLVERLPRVQEAAGSNPASPTIFSLASRKFNPACG